MAEQDPTAALARHHARVRRSSTIYAAVITVLVLVLGVVFVVAWTRGETNNTTLRTVASAPPTVPLGQPGPDVRQRWSSDARAAIGLPQWGGTVVVFDEHSVRGVNSTTGKGTWSYTRSNRTVCTAAQVAGTTVAVYRVNGNCDEVTGLDSQTGNRKWTRTLDMDAMPVDGTPVFSVATQGTFGTLMVQTPSVVYALDPSSGYNRWTFSRYGCRITGAALGSGGALISQRCGRALVCEQNVKYCGRGPQLLLRDAYAGRDEGDSAESKANPDRISWNLLGVTATPVSADDVVTALSGGALVHYDVDDGTVVTRTSLSPAPSSSPRIAATRVGSLELVSLDGTLYGLSRGVAAPRWTAGSDSEPTVLSADPTLQPAPASTRVTVTSGSEVRTLDPSTGKTTGTTAGVRVPSGSAVYPLGDGFLVAGPDGTAAYA